MAIDPSSLDVKGSLDQTIASAVQAKVQAMVLEAMAGDETMKAFVVSALSQPVQLDRYDRSKAQPFLHHTLAEAIKQITQATVRELLQERKDQIRAMVETQLVDRLPALAERLAESTIGDRAQYVSVNLDFSVTRRGY
jgi:hypothetical protein